MSGASTGADGRRGAGEFCDRVLFWFQYRIDAGCRQAWSLSSSPVVSSSSACVCSSSRCVSASAVVLVASAYRTAGVVFRSLHAFFLDET